MRRTGAPSDDERTFDDLAWSALRSYQPDEADYGGQTRLGVRIRASGQLTGRLDRRLRHWSARRCRPGTAPNGPRPLPSSNPAWIFRWYAHGIYRAVRRTGSRPRGWIAGAGLAPAPRRRRGPDRVGRLVRAAQGLRCDFVLDRPLSHAEVLTLIARCGRAAVTWQTGKLGVIWDADSGGLAPPL